MIEFSIIFLNNCVNPGYPTVPLRAATRRAPIKLHRANQHAAIPLPWGRLACSSVFSTESPPGGAKLCSLQGLPMFRIQGAHNVPPEGCKYTRSPFHQVVSSNLCRLTCYLKPILLTLNKLTYKYVCFMTIIAQSILWF